LLFQQFLEWRRSTGGKQRDGVSLTRPLLT
jgi:hypothetical protein